jgi:hypothetical protein
MINNLKNNKKKVSVEESKKCIYNVESSGGWLVDFQDIKKLASLFFCS